MRTILLIILILLLVGVFPYWGYSSAGGITRWRIGLVLLIVLILALMGNCSARKNLVAVSLWDRDRAVGFCVFTHASPQDAATRRP